MNRKLHILWPLLLLLITSNISSQDLKPLKTNANLKKGHQIESICFDVPPLSEHSSESNIPSILSATNRSGVESFIGSTLYDLQTNFSTTPRLYNFGDGTLSAVWTQGNTPTAYPSRGTGYNHFDQDWMPIPSNRLEALDRTG